jgi:hypothetical protein
LLLMLMLMFLLVVTCCFFFPVTMPTKDTPSSWVVSFLCQRSFHDANNYGPMFPLLLLFYDTAYSDLPVSRVPAVAE